MIGSIDLEEILNIISKNLQTPVAFVLLLMLIISVILLGTVIGEFFTERIYLRRKMPKLPVMVENIREREDSLEMSVAGLPFLKRHKEIMLELTRHPDITDSERESLAVRLLTEQRMFYERRTRLSDLIAKMGPMFGLMGTLIPLGPGIIALGQGDTFTLSNSLSVAFDTTIAGILCAVLALCISTLRKEWYKNDMSILETMMECILEEVEIND